MTGSGFIPVSDDDIQDTVAKALYGILIPTSWLLSAEPVNVAVVRSNFVCDDDHRTRKNAVCWKGYFWELKAAIGPYQTCKSQFCPPHDDGCNNPDICTANDLSDAPGLDALDGDSRSYGGVKPTELIQG